MSSNPPQKVYKALLFDMDGTLLDSFTAHYKAYQVMFSHFGIQLTKEQFLRTYSPDWYKTYEATGLPREVWELADKYWLEEAAKHLPELFPGTMDTLNHLYKKYLLGVVTSGSKSRVMRELETTGIKRFFQTLITGDDVQNAKPAPEGIVKALEHLGVPANEAVLIGDASADSEMAQAAGVDFIGIPSEFGSLKADHPCTRIERITDLPGFLT